MHVCDNRRCVRPSHLRLGTYRDNTQDMLAKSRAQRGPDHYSKRRPDLVVRGERSGMARLSELDVLTIRQAHADGLTFYRLAKIYGVNGTTIARIVRRERWNHI